MKLDQFTENLAQPGQEPKQMALFYGDSFAGKTYAVGQFARKYNLIWFDLEQGATTLATAIPKEFHKNVELIQVQDTMEEPIATKTLLKVVKGDKAVKINPNTGAIWSEIKDKDIEPIVLDMPNLDTNTVLVIDSLTQLSDSSMAHFLGRIPELGYKKKEYAHYDQQGLYLKNLFVCCQRLKCHVVFITHQENIEQEDGSEKITPTGGTRNFARTIARKFDHVVHCKVHNRKHSYNSTTSKDHRVIAGSRLNVDIPDAESVANLFSHNGEINKEPESKTSAKTNPLAKKFGK